MSSDTEMAPASVGDNTHQFEFTGSAGEMGPIIFKNLLLNIITLGFYRFWGRTNIRRYLWSNVRFMGDPLEYTGRGGELFVGFLIVFVVVFVPLIALILWAQTLMASGDPLGLIVFAITYAFLLWLIPLGLYRAFKYRMSRTRWRGIRGAQLESGVRYATEFFSFTIFTVLTLGLLLPVMDNKLFKLESNNRRFGTGKFSYHGTSGSLYGGFLLSYGLVIVGYVAVFALMAGSLLPSFNAINTQGSSDARQMAESIQMAMYIQFGAIFLFYVILGLAFVVYEFSKLKAFWNNTHFENCEFQFSGTMGELIRLYLGNIFIVIFTLGIAYPIAQMRIVRFMAEHIVLVGDLDLASIGQ